MKTLGFFTKAVALGAMLALTLTATTAKTLPTTKELPRIVPNCNTTMLDTRLTKALAPVCQEPVLKDLKIKK